jgi:hypothetical protein
LPSQATENPIKIMVKNNKKSKEQIREFAFAGYGKLKENIGNEEYRKKRIQENVLIRQKRIEELGEEEFKKIQKDKMAKYRQNKKENLHSQATEMSSNYLPSDAT